MVHTRLVALMLVGTLMQAGMQDIVHNEQLRRHFNHVMVVHLESIGFALAQPSAYPDVDPQRGLALRWQEIALDDGLDGLVRDAQTCALAQELYACAKNKQVFSDAAEYVRALEESGADEQVLQNARFHMQALYVAGLVEEVNARGCMVKRPDSAPKLADLQPGQGGSFIAADAHNWGDLGYLADLLQANAYLDVVTHDHLLRALTLAQLIFRAEQA